MRLHEGSYKELDAYHRASEGMEIWEADRILEAVRGALSNGEDGALFCEQHRF
jgi:hypothetical protein